jgi:spore maturation protein SpmA
MLWLSKLVLALAAACCNDSARALACSVFNAAAFTFKVTPTVCGLLPAPVDITVTDPL